MRRVLVTGASGFVGRHLLPALRGEFPSARVFAAQRGGAVPGADEMVSLDLDDAASCLDAVARTRPDAVIHLAARSSVAHSFVEPAAVWRTNLMGTLALADAVLRRAPEAIFLLASSAEVYGLTFRRGEPLDETATLSPANPYAASKAAADLAVGEMALRGLRAVRMRAVNHTGAGQSPSFVVAAFARQVALIAAGRQEPVLRVGALDRWRDFLDVADVCGAYLLALRAAPGLEPGCALNVGSGRLRDVRGVLADLLRLAGVEARIETDAARLRSTDVVRAAVDVSAARDALHWEPRVPWERTLATVLADWRDRVAKGE